MTTFYLHGGYGEKPESHEYQLLISGFAREPLLYLGHANPDPQRRLEKQQDLINNCNSLASKPLIFTIASDLPNIIISQLASHTIWILGGGQPQRIVDLFTSIPNFEDLISNKTIFGSSAGAMVWCTNYYSPDTGAFGKGLGIVPLNILVHYTDQMADKAQQIQVLGPGIDTWCLKEHQYQQFNLDTKS